MLEGDPPTTDLRLDESEQRYQAVIDNASDMIQSVRPDGSFEFVNKAWKNSLLYTDDDVSHMSIWDIIHPDSVEHCQIDFMRAIRGEPVDFLQTHFVAKDGRTVPVEGSVTSRLLGEAVVATHGFFRDISERLRSRELEERATQLEREERARYLEKMAALGKLSAGLAHELNNPAAAVQRANAGLKETLVRRDVAMRELGEAGLVASIWQALDETLGAARAHERDTDPVVTGATEAAIETWIENQDIARSWELAPSLAEAGVTVQALDALSEQLPAPTLPAAITWVTETLVLDESTEIIAESSRRIADLVRAIKGYSHMDRATEHDGDIHEGLENTLVILGHRIRNLEVSRQYDRSLPTIRMYGNTLNQVWTNILDNAIDATNGEGRLVIRTRLHDDHVVVEIEDNGCGIPAENLSRVFEPFFTSKLQGQGIGLGLDTVWRIVTKEHDGTISVTSRPGKTVFHVSLPIAPSPGADDTAP